MVFLIFGEIQTESDRIRYIEERNLRVRVRERMCVCERVCVRVCVRVGVCEGVCMSVCVCEGEREHELNIERKRDGEILGGGIEG